MVYDEVVEVAEAGLLPSLLGMFGLEGYKTSLINPHEGGRNVVYDCRRDGADPRILRISFLGDRSHGDLLAEVEYIRYLHAHGGSVPGMFDSLNGNPLEVVNVNGQALYACLFERARGKGLAENGYRYREDAPLSEYHYNCGKTLGNLHRLSKGYIPVHRRHSFFDFFNGDRIDGLVPDSLPLLKEKLIKLVDELEGLDRNRETFGMLHFDYNDGNYVIDYDTGRLTVFDFDNSCFGCYMFDLASLWMNGMGWVQFEPDAVKRKGFMDGYFATALAGYRSETGIDGSMLDKLPLFIQANLMESIIDEFERVRANGGEPEYDGELAYRIRCLEDDIPYMGFFDGIYSCEAPFEWIERNS